MAVRKGGLGKGLDALFVDNAPEDGKTVTLRLSDIEPNREQPRKDFDEAALDELAQSIAEHGVLQPLLVRPIAGGSYQLVAGERRWRASRIAGLQEVPVVIREMSDAEMMELALIENLQREDLNAMEEAEGFRLLMERYDMTQEEVAKRVGKSRPAVANAVRLLGLPEPVRQSVREGALSPGHARTLLAFRDEAELLEAAELAIARGMSVRELERRAKSASKQSEKPAVSKRPASRESFFDEVELALTEQLGRRVKVLESGGKGRIELEFYSREDLMQLANRVAGENPGE